jgi:allantoinase
MEHNYDLVIRANRVVTPEGIRAASVMVSGGTIREVGARGAAVNASAERILDDGEVLLPGLLDSHVHVNEPGRTEWEGFPTATAAAAAGGVTTIVDMPLNSIPSTVTTDALRIKRDSAAGRVGVDVGFWGGAIPGNLGTLRSLHDAGVFGFKCFLAPSGVDEFPHLTTDELRQAMAEVAEFDGLLIVHAEDPGVLSRHENTGGVQYSRFLESRPPESEMAAIASVIDAARATGARAHILHLSSAAALPQIAAAKSEGLRITVETCPHYLCFTAESIPDGGTQFKCCPPIRDEGNRDRLWQGLVDGTVDCIVSDHSPSTRELKLGHGGDFALAWGGISGLQVGLPAVWTEASRRGISLERVVEWMSARPAALVGLSRKGGIAPGKDADFAVFAPGNEFTVSVDELHHRNAVSAFEGRQLTGVVRRTFLRGREILRAPDADPVPGTGTLLSRTSRP